MLVVGAAPVRKRSHTRTSCTILPLPAAAPKGRSGARLAARRLMLVEVPGSWDSAANPPTRHHNFRIRGGVVDHLAGQSDRCFGRIIGEHPGDSRDGAVGLLAVV